MKIKIPDKVLSNPKRMKTIARWLERQMQIREEHICEECGEMGECYSELLDKHLCEECYDKLDGRPF